VAQKPFLNWCWSICWGYSSHHWRQMLLQWRMAVLQKSCIYTVILNVHVVLLRSPSSQHCCCWRPIHGLVLVLWQVRCCKSWRPPMNDPPSQSRCVRSRLCRGSTPLYGEALWVTLNSSHLPLSPLLRSWGMIKSLILNRALYHMIQKYEDSHGFHRPHAFWTTSVPITWE